MMNKRSILILAEGFEEKPYIEKIINVINFEKEHPILTNRDIE